MRNTSYQWDNKTEPTQDLDMWTSDPSNIVTELSPDLVIRASQVRLDDCTLQFDDFMELTHLDNK